MQLVVDVGNTETVIGLASGKRELAGHWRISSSVSRTIDEMRVLVRAFLSNNALGDSEITRGVVGSVVPTANRVWTKTLRRIVTGEVLVIDPRSALPIELDVEEPMSVGADRIANTLAARELYHRDTIVVDLGTATTFDCITTEGVFKGGAISIDGMVQRLREEWDRPDTYVVATGGFSNTIGPHLASIDRIEPFLTLFGLAMAGEYLEG